MTVRIGIMGDFNPESPAHSTIAPSLEAAGRELAVEVEPSWLSTPSLVGAGGEKLLAEFHGLWASPASPYQSMAGMLHGIEFARCNHSPFVGTWGGFQYALVEHARNVMGLTDADTAENSSGSRHIVITPVLCAVPNRAEGEPKLLGPIAGIRIESGTLLHSLYGQDETVEEHFCNYEVNPEYLGRFRASGLRLSAWGPQGELKAIELPTHTFFVAMLYQPQRARKQPHPVITGYLRAAAACSARRSAQRAAI